MTITELVNDHLSSRFPSMPHTPVERRRYKTTFRVILALIVVIASAAGITGWLLLSDTGTVVVINIQPKAFVASYREDAESLELGALVTVTNISDLPVWIDGHLPEPAHDIQIRVNGNWESYSYGPTPLVVDSLTQTWDLTKYNFQRLVNGEWKNFTFSTQNLNYKASPLGRKWTQLRSRESTTFVMGIRKDVEAMRVGVAVSSERIAPTNVDWIYSRPMKIIKRGTNYFPE